LHDDKKGSKVPSPRLIVFFGLLIVSVSLALFKGGKPERTGALIILAMTALQFGSRALGPAVYRSVDQASVIVDLFGVISFGILAIYAMRVWPIWAASLQLLSLTSHFTREVSAREQPLVYVAMKSGPTFVVLMVLLLGTIFHLRRMRRWGDDPAWKDW
jgi:hypothetical protein